MTNTITTNCCSIFRSFDLSIFCFSLSTLSLGRSACPKRDNFPGKVCISGYAVPVGLRSPLDHD